MLVATLSTDCLQPEAVAYMWEGSSRTTSYVTGSTSSKWLEVFLFF